MASLSRALCLVFVEVVLIRNETEVIVRRETDYHWNNSMVIISITMDPISWLYRSCPDLFDLVCVQLDFPDLLTLMRVNRLCHTLLSRSRCSIWMVWWKHNISQSILPVGSHRSIIQDIHHLLPRAKLTQGVRDSRVWCDRMIEQYGDAVIAAQMGYERWIQQRNLYNNSDLFYIAATNNNLTLCKEMLSKQLDPVPLDTFILVVRFGYVDVLAFLFKNRDHPTLRPSYSYMCERLKTVSVDYVMFRHPHVARFLMESDLPLKKEEFLVDAAIIGDLELVKWVWDSGYRQSLNCAFLEAIHWRKYEIALFLLDKGVHIGHLALNSCIERKDMAMARKLLAHGADPIAQDNTPIIQCCAYGDLEMVQLLASLGADPRCWNDEPLITACRRGHLALAMWLLDIGADPSSQGNKAFEMAHLHGHTSIVQLLMDRGAQAHSNKSTFTVKGN